MTRMLSLKHALLASTLLVSSQAIAQDVATPESDFIGTIVLQAINDGGAGVSDVEASNTAGSRVPVNPQDLPRSVTTLPRALFEAQGARTLEEAASYSPGIATETYGRDDRYDEFTLRGFEVQLSGNYRDGMPLRTVDFAGWRTELFGIESVNILRGPTSDLYGANQPGGLINSVSKRPQFTFGGQVRTAIKSDGGAEAAIDITGPLSDNVAYRFIALKNEFGTNFDEVDTGRTYIAPSLTFGVTEDTTITVYGQYQKDDVGDVYVNVPEYGSLRDNANGTWDRDLYTSNPDRNDVEAVQTFLGYEAEHRFSDQLSFVSRARSARSEWDFDTEFATAFVNISYLVNPLFGLPPVGEPGDIDTGVMTKFTVDQTLEQRNFDNALHYKFDTETVKGQLAFGIDRLSLDSDLESALGYTGERNYVTGDVTQFLAGRLPTDLRNERDVELEQTGIYISGFAEFNDRYIVSGGIRRDTVDYRARGFNTLLDASVAEFDNKIEDTFTSANLALGYRLTPEWMIYGSTARSFSLPLGGVRADGSAIDVETARSYEVGLKFASLDQTSALSIAYFDITKSDILAADPSDNRFVTQVGEVRSRGVEIEGTYDFQNGLSLFGSLTMTDAEITEDAQFEGNKVARVPDVTAALFAQYEVPQVEGLAFGLGARYTGTRFSDEANDYEIDPVTLVDASVSYQKDNLSIMAAMRNVADTEFIGFCNAKRPVFNNETLDSVSGGCVYGAGREVSLTASWRF